MPLLALWNSNQIAVGEFSIEQIVATAGDGALRDDSVCSSELREYLSQIPVQKIATYVDQCLGSALNRGGLILQDLVNEVGRRLDFRVTNGRYQGIAGSIGYDGIWLSPHGHSIVVEVKTTDAYRISLNTLAEYRDRLASAGQFSGPSSILIVVGRQDTGELEAQIRGSRHAWDVRLISVEALLKLVRLKENAEGLETGRKIRSLLAPMEYTRLDQMVDVMFATATDVENTTILADSENGDRPDEERTSKGGWEFTDSALLQRKRESIILALGRDRGAALIRKSRALFWSADHKVRAACSVSKRYTKRSSYPYWYAFHPQWDDFLSEAEQSYFVLGCMDLDVAFAIPGKEFVSRLGALNVTVKDDGSRYWHVHLIERSPGSYAIILPKQPGFLKMDEYMYNLA